MKTAADTLRFVCDDLFRATMGVFGVYDGIYMFAVIASVEEIQFESVLLCDGPQYGRHCCDGWLFDWTFFLLVGIDKCSRMGAYGIQKLRLE